MSKEQARKEILQKVNEYTKSYLVQKDAFKEGDKIPYACRIFNEDEIVNLIDSALDFWLTAGRYTDEFEKKLAVFLDIKYCTFVNSGSSANLLAFMALTSPLLEKRRIMRGDEVITVAAGFPTTISPILQYGAIPVFVDMHIPSYNIDVTLIKNAISARTKAIMVAHTLGNPVNLKELIRICKKNNLWLIEDNCDALGSKYKRAKSETTNVRSSNIALDDDWQYTGTFGDIGTSSFYPPHHMTTGEGGAVYTDNPLLEKIIKSMRDWGRDCSCPSGVDNKCGARFDGEFGLLPKGYDHKYVYSHFGYNLKATDMQAAIGVAQIDKLAGFIEKRKQNFAILREKLLKIPEIEKKFILPEKEVDSDPSWFGFLLTVKSDTNKGFTRDKVVKTLEDAGIQTRALFAGNIIKHPCFDEMREDGSGYFVVDRMGRRLGSESGDHAMPVTEQIMNDSFWIGVYPGMTDEMLDFMVQKLGE